MNTYQKTVDLINHLSDIFLSQIHRCENCGADSDIFICDDCEHDRVEFVSGLVDVVNLAMPNDSAIELFTCCVPERLQVILELKPLISEPCS